jgi:signal transduction histidine kinase
MRRRRAEWSLRARLTWLTAGVFLVVGAALLTLTYFLVLATVPPETPAQALRHQELLECQQEQQAAASRGSAASNSAGVAAPAEGFVPPAKFCHDVFRQAAEIGSTSSRSSTLHWLLLYSVIGLFAMTGVAAGAAWTLSGRALRPLRDVTAAAGRASRETLGDRLAVPEQSGELKELAITFNDMLDRLDSVFSAQERFVADASHELRTPLTALGAVVDVAARKPNPGPEQLARLAGDIHGLLSDANALIDALLVLSRSDAGITAKTPMDLAEVVAATLKDRADGFTIDAQLSAVPLCADRILVERAVANLVDNAVSHNDDRRWIGASTFSSPSEAGLTIESTGAEIAASEASELFRPFYRVAGRTGRGHGLGLAIVRSVAVAHGGRCEAQPRPGGGLTVVLTFPSAVGPTPDNELVEVPSHPAKPIAATVKTDA